MKKSIFIIFSCFLSIVLFAGMASAHVTVYPKETTQGKYEKFSVRVPSEKEGTSTIKVELEIPADVNISRVEPKSGWEYSIVKDDTDKITSVVWETSEEGLSQIEFTDFNVQGKVSDQATSLFWKAYQSYADGSVVEWVGAAGSDKPASVSLVVEKNTQTVNVQAETASPLPYWLSIISLILAGIALAVTLIIFKKYGKLIKANVLGK